MALELVALAAAVPKILEGIQACLGSIGEIRSGLGARNDRAKRDLAATMDDLQARLKDVGKLARAAEAYLRTRESLADLRSECAQAEAFLQENLKEATDWASAQYESNWRIVTSMLDRIDGARLLPRQVVTNRAEWYDQRDADQVGIFLGQFDAAFAEARGYANARQADTLVAQLGRMIGSLRDADAVLQATVYGTILSSLASLEAR